ncbi:MAG: tRNA lysidine(34) synthetase TilS [Rickettsiales bacterium]|jgi:tRNA(Ile)-lysidine synthase|nr:tRNA lysidine(34) synthetase TilS [Rickettsiales bacterium]
MNNKFTSFINALPKARIAVAVSGGADSMALMHWCADYKPVVLTIDHGLRNESAAEAEMVGRVAKKLGLEHHTLKWVGDKPDTGVEEAAREARYNLMLDFCRANNIGILMTAHHADDNIETFLMNLGRGSGLFGLGGLRPISERGGITIARPLLEVRRAELRDWCVKNSVDFVDDPMNDDEQFLRVRVRKNRGILAEKLGISDERLLLAISSLARARDASEGEIEKLLLNFDGNYSTLENLPEEMKLKFFSRILQQVGGDAYPPRLDSVQRALKELEKDATITLAHCIVKRKGNIIRIENEKV